MAERRVTHSPKLCRFESGLSLHEATLRSIRRCVRQILSIYLLILNFVTAMAQDGAPRLLKGVNPMTLEEIKSSTKLFLFPADIAPILQTDPHTIRCTARQRPELLGFEFTFTGNRMKIPRLAFLRWLGEIT